jgi:hypothetical protein
MIGHTLGAAGRDRVDRVRADALGRLRPSSINCEDVHPAIEEHADRSRTPRSRCRTSTSSSRPASDSVT